MPISIGGYDMLYDDLVQPGEFICHYGVKGMEWGKVKALPYQPQKPNSSPRKTVSNVSAPPQQSEKSQVSRPKHPQQSSNTNSQAAKDNQTKPQRPSTTQKPRNKTGEVITNHASLPTGVADRNSEEILRVEQNAAARQRQNTSQQQARNRKRLEETIRRWQIRTQSNRRRREREEAEAQRTSDNIADLISFLLGGTKLRTLTQTNRELARSYADSQQTQDPNVRSYTTSLSRNARENREPMPVRSDDPIYKNQDIVDGLVRLLENDLRN